MSMFIPPIGFVRGPAVWHPEQQEMSCLKVGNIYLFFYIFLNYIRESVGYIVKGIIRYT